MVQLPVFYGEWVVRESCWHFDVDFVKGGRMFTLGDGCTHRELVEMSQDEYKLGSRADLVDLTYSLPATMLVPGSPPIYVTTDRQVRSMIELSRTHQISLCVSSRVVGDGMSDVDMGENDVEADDNCEEKADEDWEEDGDEDDEWSDVGDDFCKMVKDEEIFNKDAEAYCDGEDYEAYGQVKDEDKSEDEDERCFGGPGMRASHFHNGKRPWSDGLYVSASFDNKEALKAELRLTAIKTKFPYKIDKSDKSLFVGRCKVKGCNWMVRAGLKHDSHTFWVTKYEKVHTCSVSDRIATRKRYAPKYIAELFLKEYGKSIDKTTPQEIKDFLQHSLGIKMSYTTAYRALIHATTLVRGSPEDGYARLPSFLHKLQLSNPGTVTALDVDADNRFKYLFLAFGASIHGFQYCRRVIVVDGTHLTGKFGGVMLVACAQDANFQIFPLAFGVVDTENDDSWEWFLTKLRECIGDQDGLVIISDRHNSIKKACETVLPLAKRGICYYHLQCNIVMKFKGKHLLYLVKNAAYAFTLYDFNRYMASLREVNPDLANYLENADVKLWSRVHFPGDRYNIKTSNIAESLNSALKTARGFPITYLLEFIRSKLGKWFCNRRADALSLTTHFSRGVEYLLSIRDYYANMMTAEAIDGWRFYVKGGHRDCIVDLEHRTCECGVWQVEKIPCSHAIAAAPEIELQTSTLVSPFYGSDYLYTTYSRNVFPPNDGFKVPETANILPPVYRRQPGRQKKSRWQTWLEIAATKGKPKPRKLHKQYSCSGCKQPGHILPNCVRYNASYL